MTRSIPFRLVGAPLLAVAVLGLAGCGLFGKGKPVTPTTGNRVPILSRIEISAKPDPTLQGVAVVLPPTEANAAWPQAGNTANKSYGNLALAASPQRVWGTAIAGSSGKRRLAATPVIGDGRLYVIDTEGQVHAFAADSGAEIWRTGFETKGDGAASVFGGGVSFDNGKAYVTTGLGDVAALDAATGKLLWKVRPAGPLRGSPTIALNSVYVMTQNNEIFALNAADGAQLWNESGSLGQTGVFGVAAPAVGQGTIVAGYSSGELVAYRYENGRSLWTDALARTSLSTMVGVLTDIDADPIIDRGRVYALGQGGRMAAYELVSGQRIWELNLAGISTPAVAGDWIFVLTDEAKLICIARTSGKVRWVTQMMRYRNEEKKKNPVYWSGPVLAGNRLWMTNSRGEIWSAATADGAASQFTQLGDSITLPPIVANQTLYILDDGGHINAFR